MTPEPVIQWAKEENTMTQIILTPEQMKLYNEATAPIQVCDTYGKVLATFTPDWSKAFIAMLKHRARLPGGTYTSEQVSRFLKALEKAWQREGPFDEKRLTEIVEEYQASSE
jgi:hypothetical protein